MKNFLTLLSVRFVSGTLIAQVPQAFNYQNRKSASGTPLANQNISLRFAINQGIATKLTFEKLN
jgi:hypothetical protein